LLKSDQKGSRRDSVACSFSYFFNEQRLGYNLSIPLNIPNILDDLPTPITLGDHLRHRRLELGLRQKEIAGHLGVTESCIWNWEHGWKIGSREQVKVEAWLEASSPHEQ
jgi:DNA-binding XRE family transcriptional regulator